MPQEPFYFYFGYLHGYSYNPDDNNELLPCQDWESNIDDEIVLESDVKGEMGLYQPLMKEKIQKNCFCHKTKFY